MICGSSTSATESWAQFAEGERPRLAEAARVRKETEARIRDDLAAWFAERERLRKTPYRGASNQYDPARDEETHVRDRMLASAMAVNDGRETSDEIRALAVMMARVVIEVRLVRSTKRSSGS